MLSLFILGDQYWPSDSVTGSQGRTVLFRGSVAVCEFGSGRLRIGNERRCSSVSNSLNLFYAS